MDPEELDQINAYFERDAQLREILREENAKLDKKVRSMVGTLSKVHSTPASDFPGIVDVVRRTLSGCNENLLAIVSLIPPNQLWRWKETWAYTIRSIVYIAAFTEFLASGKLISLQEVNDMVGIQETWNDRLEIQVEDYLQGLITLINELSRLAVNSVTLGNYDAPFKISIFVKDLFAGFSLLNLKNDSLRRRFDSIKYDVKKIEEVVYDVSLRQLNNPPAESKAA
ncbi:hypothetical protein BOTBODRAFT_35375 [Botryobasidium botryosum FD-172 SS1]|uniref:Translin n=1 Tax=Botryobasidium botryosum (strain FD-172 SS1) TaxID=930990 RepID=A0A067M9W6_BOTB1|nr:hypothetical protein BOTBODRAFT_35375 [Botryobasidium botryosum FD-172 SS1]